jgi:hypothetical protein
VDSVWGWHGGWRHVRLPRWTACRVATEEGGLGGLPRGSGNVGATVDGNCHDDGRKKAAGRGGVRGAVWVFGLFAEAAGFGCAASQLARVGVPDFL